MRKLFLMVSSVAAASTVGVAAQAQPYGPGMMGDWGGWGYGGYGLIHLIVWVVILAAIIAGVVWLVRSLAAPRVQNLPPRRSAGLDVLEERYARGEINRDEYLQKKGDLAG